MRRLLVLLLLGCFLPATASAQSSDAHRLVDLRGSWRFALGHDPTWQAERVDEAGWTSVFVPGAWEDEGFPGYDGHAWYRRHFTLGAADLKTPGRFVLALGRIDDVDAVYVNGRFVGSTGRFPPHYQTGYHAARAYTVPASFLNAGDNVVAVHVYDAELSGGVLDGAPGLYLDRAQPPLVVDLAGTWQFRTGENPAWRDEHVPKEGWAPITVPGRWEPQGYPGYDGHAWYRRRVFVPRDAPDDLVLVLGRVDDADAVYVNGVLVGQTGTPAHGSFRGDDWQRLRVYPVEPGLLRRDGYNTVAVHVYDGLYDGGIYEGPIGLMAAADAARWLGTEPSAWEKLKTWWFGQE